jgi:Mce-associated membrane protein
MARPNRPRIAGQRRRPDDSTHPAGSTGPVDTQADDTTRPQDAVSPPAAETGTTTPAEVTPETSEVVESEVTQTTPGTPEPLFRPITDEEMATLSDDELSRVIVLDQDPRKEADRTPVPAGGRSLSVVLSVVLAVLIVLILAFAGILGVKAWRGQQAEDARNAAATAGRKAAETALSYDYRSLDKNFAAARATMTADFAAKFDATAKVAGELATKSKATVRADVREVGVRDGDADRVTLVIFVNQTTTSTITQGKPRVDLNRTRFTMVRNGDQWLVQEISGL